VNLGFFRHRVGAKFLGPVQWKVRPDDILNKTKPNDASILAKLVRAKSIRFLILSRNMMKTTNSGISIALV
jgi:hypothetical protein